MEIGISFLDTKRPQIFLRSFFSTFININKYFFLCDEEHIHFLFVEEMWF